jgi:hypothetical protein
MSLTYHFVIAVDVAGFSKVNAAEQLRIQTDLGRTLNTAATRAGLDREGWYRQVGGDGELAVLPADTDGLQLVDAYPRELGDALAKLNRNRNPRLRLRMAIHHGSLVEGIFGPVGQAPILVSRLLDSDALRRELARQVECDYVLAVSAEIYANVIGTHLGGLDPAEFTPIQACVKDVAYPAYIFSGHRSDQMSSFSVAIASSELKGHSDDGLLETAATA